MRTALTEQLCRTALPPDRPPCCVGIFGFVVGENTPLSFQSFQSASPCLFWFAVMRFLDVLSLILSLLGFYAIVFSLRLLLPRNIVPLVLAALNEAMALLERDEAIYIPNLSDYRENLAMCAHT
jgi:hypothetical protein